MATTGPGRAAPKVGASPKRMTCPVRVASQ